MSYIRIILDVGLDATQFTEKLKLNGTAVDGPRDLQRLAQFIEGNDSGRGSNLRVVKNAVRATQIGTFTDEPTAADTLTINGVAFTARASGAVANEFNLVTGGTSAADAAGNAAALAAAINASTSAKIKNIIKASSALGVLTLTCLIPGSIGNLCTVTESMGNFTLTGTVLAGGTEDTEILIDAGRAA